MKALKITTLSLLIMLAASPAFAGFGLGAALQDFDAFGVQARTAFGLGGDISEITGSAAIYFDNTWMSFDADYHFILKGGKTRFYPLAGLELATDFGDWTEFGVNLGGGLNFMMTETLAAYAEAKFVAWGVDGLNLTLGFRF
jgi:opacity protein-like surface antigen